MSLRDSCKFSRGLRNKVLIMGAFKASACGHGKVARKTPWDFTLKN